MTRNGLIALAGALSLAPVTAAGQGRWSATAATIFESYTFTQGLPFDRVSELTIPLGLTYDLGRIGNVALSTGFASVTLNGTDSTLGRQHVSGPLDTEARFSLNVIPGRLVVLLTGSAPTGMKTVDEKQLAILGAVSSDIVGFAASNLGTGGNMGGGFAAALPFGRWAGGVGGTYKQPMGYEPLATQQSLQFRPGSEMRLRVGIEGPLARRTYVRAAGIMVRTAKDHVAFSGADSTRNGVGHRLITYLSANQGIGSMSLTAYGFDVFRGDPQIEPTATGAARLPRGNLMALGGRLDVPLGPVTTVTPGVEWRTSSAASDSSTTLTRLGSSLKVGADLRRRLTPLASLVAQGGFTTGSLIQPATQVDISGFRFALHLEITP